MRAAINNSNFSAIRKLFKHQFHTPVLKQFAKNFMPLKFSFSHAFITSARLKVPFTWKSLQLFWWQFVIAHWLKIELFGRKRFETFIAQIHFQFCSASPT